MERDRTVMLLLDKAQKGGARYFASFAQRPADSLLNQVVFVGEKYLGDTKRILSFAVPDERKRGYDRDAALPWNRRSGKPIQHLSATHP